MHIKCRGGGEEFANFFLHLCVLCFFVSSVRDEYRNLKAGFVSFVVKILKKS